MNLVTVFPGTESIFESGAQTLVNPVNCVGVAGKGLALEFRKRFPSAFKEYVALCKAGRILMGWTYLYQNNSLPWILCFSTKQHWKDHSSLREIVHGLEHLKLHYIKWGITSLAVPALGCGEGKLDWKIVEPILYKELSKLGIPVMMYAPHN